MYVSVDYTKTKVDRKANVEVKNKNRGFTRLSITKKKKTLLTDSIYIPADYGIIEVQ
jgi:hypothetical protein